jgi:hypothetical protein
MSKGGEFSSIAGFFLACACVLAQQKQAEYRFVGPANEAVCRNFPAPIFTIKPSMDRWNSGDLLTVRCSDGILSLTFAIDSAWRSPSGINQKLYYFRWGESKNPGHTGLEGQFTRNEKRCKEIADRFGTVVARILPPADKGATPMRWSAGCYADDQWGTSMEFTLSGYPDKP